MNDDKITDEVREEIEGHAQVTNDVVDDYEADDDLDNLEAQVEAAEAEEMDQLNIEYEKVQQACDNCHKKYKEE